MSNVLKIFGQSFDFLNDLFALLFRPSYTVKFSASVISWSFGEFANVIVTFASITKSVHFFKTSTHFLYPLFVWLRKIGGMCWIRTNEASTHGASFTPTCESVAPFLESGLTRHGL